MHEFMNCQFMDVQMLGCTDVLMYGCMDAPTATKPFQATHISFRAGTSDDCDARYSVAVYCVAGSRNLIGDISSMFILLLHIFPK